MKRIPIYLFLVGAAIVGRSLAAETVALSADEAAIHKISAAYTAAFNKHDAASLAGFWSPDAVYLNRTTGEEVVGRKAIAEQFTAYFKTAPDVKMTAATEAIQFVSPNVAIETGTSKTLAPKTEPEEDEYSAVYVKRDGQWLLDRITDKEQQAAAAFALRTLEATGLDGRQMDR